MNQAIVPHLWFKDQAEEAMRFYTSLFPDGKIHKIVYYPTGIEDPHFEGMNNKVLMGVFELNGQLFYCLDGGDHGFGFNDAISFVVECEDQAEIDYYWSRLSDGQHEQCGWCKDKFGLSWQILPKELELILTSPAQIEALMKMKKIVIAELKALAVD